MKRYLWPLAIFVVLVGFLAVGLNLDPGEVPSPLIDKPAPDFAAPQLMDTNKSISRDDLLGQVSLVNVFASWCVACLDEHPLLTRLARSGIVSIYGLNYKDDREDATRWLARHGNPYTTIAVDPSGRIGLDWGVYGVPETFILDHKGVIRYKHIGPISPQSLQQTILPWIDRLKAERG